MSLPEQEYYNRLIKQFYQRAKDYENFKQYVKEINNEKEVDEGLLSFIWFKAHPDTPKVWLESVLLKNGFIG